MAVKQGITLLHRVAQKPGNIVSDMDGEKVMLSVKNGKYYNLGQMGGVIWDRIEEPVLIGDLVNSLLSEYEVEEDLCREQVTSFLEKLAEEDLITAEN
ncbi:PqqD family protein [Alteribacter lacisalsi]|uniref:PqqD family protein n=1 Tax=Alteribacter lacisalsi TaxID=2045244 RepID=A0A2W0H782_9BACI|nr:lasso peptide biosynthesis PqqD family chaperone [Alteribacter lacisalsi]PYZ96967.1 PqqD family protein [Alteribacter lacisalsi]